MKPFRIAAVIAAVVVAPPAMAQSDNPIPEGFKLAPMSRATIFVRDQEESLKLYRDILGLRVRADRDFVGDPLFNEILGTRGHTIKVKILQAGDVVYGNVGLFQLVGDDRAKIGPPPQDTAARTGDAAVVFMTNDIDGITAKVKAGGYTIIAPPMVLFPREDMAVQAREMLFRDRDGILVNLIQAGVRKAP